ncbi:MAG: NAD(P)-binding domain-containing protein, partial [Proteobacteria bacterium]|nr:NAD(P)-binding domain-containing protein [Pseudomonadota bacterium]
MIKNIGVIGAGQMGGGIAHICALAGRDVTLVDIAEEPLAKGLKAIERNLERQVSRDRISAADKDAALGRITTGVGLDKLKDADLVIEAATEN